MEETTDYTYHFHEAGQDHLALLLLFLLKVRKETRNDLINDDLLSLTLPLQAHPSQDALDGSGLLKDISPSLALL